CRNLVDGVAEISAQCGFERANCELVHAKSAEQGVAANFLHQVFIAGNDSCLRTAEELVAAKDHQRYTSFDAVSNSGLFTTGGRQVQKTAGAEVLNDGQGFVPAECH